MAPSNDHFPLWLAMADHGLMLDFTGFHPVDFPQDANKIDDNLSVRIRALADIISAQNFPYITEIVPSLTRLFIAFDTDIITSDGVKQALLPFLSQANSQKSVAGRKWCLPICYDGDCAPDLQDVAERTGLSPEQVIDRHLAKTLSVSVMGFMPGLGYMTGVDSRLTLPRRANPRTNVPERSVGIAMGQCVIYPLESPGGWNLIGRISYPLFDPTRQTPILLRAGDEVRFTRITESELSNQEDAYTSGDFTSADLADGTAHD
ncbi:MAG: 5-oxoprolinase subunit PxpB [Candidatus Puniceispirillaceae bacterium]